MSECDHVWADGLAVVGVHGPLDDHLEEKGEEAHHGECHEGRVGADGARRKPHVVREEGAEGDDRQEERRVAVADEHLELVLDRRLSLVAIYMFSKLILCEIGA